MATAPAQATVTCHLNNCSCLCWSSPPVPAVILHPAAQVIFKKQNQIMPLQTLCGIPLSSWCKIQMRHCGLQDRTWFGCCYLSLFVSYPSCLPDTLLIGLLSVPQTCHFSHLEPLSLMFFLPRMFFHGSWLWLILLFRQISARTLLECPI